MLNTPILFSVTEQTRASVCTACGQPLVQRKLEARGAYGRDGRPRITGFFWRADPHACEPVVVLEVPAP